MNEIYACIDVGSNSVRVLIWQDGKTLYQNLKTTRLGQGLQLNGELQLENMMKTCEAISEFQMLAESHRANNVMAFATEAVRSAKNGRQFKEMVQSITGLTLDVLNGYDEAEVGLLGALGGQDGGIVDIGGASTEIAVVRENRIIYEKSVPVGAVRLYDCCGENEGKLLKQITQNLQLFGDVPEARFRGVGGTATSLAQVDVGLDKYFPTLTDGHVMSIDTVEKIYFKIRDASMEEREKILHISPTRSQIIVGGALLLLNIMDRFQMSNITIKETDNMLGYIRAKVFGEGYDHA